MQLHGVGRGEHRRSDRHLLAVGERIVPGLLDVALGERPHHRLDMAAHRRVGDAE